MHFTDQRCYDVEAKYLLILLSLSKSYKKFVYPSLIRPNTLQKFTPSSPINPFRHIGRNGDLVAIPGDELDRKPRLISTFG
jgi:hypothetical protein